MNWETLVATKLIPQIHCPKASFSFINIIRVNSLTGKWGHNHLKFGAYHGHYITLYSYAWWCLYTLKMWQKYAVGIVTTCPEVKLLFMFKSRFLSSLIMMQVGILLSCSYLSLS
jgi:hypothetical protein